MILTLQITGPRDKASSAQVRKVFEGEGGTIGRLPDNDWVLPDPYVSGHHARIRYGNGTFQIEDTNSANGVFINSPDNRLQPRQPYALKTGDRVFIEPYEIEVSIESRAQDPFVIPQPVSAFDPTGYPSRSMAQPVDPYIGGPLFEEEVDPLKMLGGASSSNQKPSKPKEQPPAPPWREQYSRPGSHEPDEDLDANNRSIPTGYNPLVDAVPARPPKPPSPSPPPAPEKPPQQRNQSPPPPPPVAVPAPAPPERPRAVRDADFLAQVLAGAGLDDKAVTPELAEDFGRILRIVVSGLMDVLQARQRTKAEFGMGNTVFQPKDNNPLKFSANVEDALHNLLVKRNTAYLNPVDAFEDAFDDIRNHQIAMLAGVRVAFDAMLARFDPDRLQEQFDRKKKGALVSVPARMRYWDLYRDWIHDMVHDADDSFRELFGDDFAQAYEEQLRRLKAHGPRKS